MSNDEDKSTARSTQRRRDTHLSDGAEPRKIVASERFELLDVLDEAELLDEVPELGGVGVGKSGVGRHVEGARAR